MFLLLLLVGLPLGGLLLQRHTRRRVAVELSEEYLLVDRYLPPSTRRRTRLSLRAIRSVWLRTESDDLSDVGLRIDADGFDTIDVPCARLEEAKRLLAHIRAAIARAPGAVLRRSERPPETLEQMARAAGTLRD